MAKKWILEAVYAALETTFNTDPDATGAQYKFLKSLGSTFDPTVAVVERPAMTNDMTRQSHVIGAKGGKVTLKLEVKASGTPAVSAVAAVAAELDPVLQSVLGAVARGTGSTIGATPGSASAPQLASATGLQKGMALHFANGLGPGGNGEVRFITAIAGPVVTLDRALSAVPTTGQVVSASSVYNRVNSGHKSLAIVGTRDSVEYTFTGCKVDSFKLSGISAGGTAIADVTLSVGSWSVTTKSGSSLPVSSAVTLAGINAVKAPVIKGSPFALSGAERPVADFSFDPGMTFDYVMTTTDIDNKGGMEAVGAKPAGSFTSYYNVDQVSDWTAATNKSVAFSSGTPSTGGWGIFAPQTQYTAVAAKNQNGLYTEQINFAVNDNGADPEFWISLF